MPADMSTAAMPLACISGRPKQQAKPRASPHGHTDPGLGWKEQVARGPNHPLTCMLIRAFSKLHGL